MPVFAKWIFPFILAFILSLVLDASDKIKANLMLLTIFVFFVLFVRSLIIAKRENMHIKKHVRNNSGKTPFL